jgi:hypothetical protein
LSRISFFNNDLTGCNFAGQNLTNANFYGAALTGAEFTAADARGTFLYAIDGTTVNVIWHDGHIYGFDLGAARLLVVHNYNGPSYNPALVIPITIDQYLTMGPGGTLRMVFEADAWDSTISFAPGIPITFGGTLELTFAANVNLAS